MTYPNHPCGCELGERCTVTTLCAQQEAVADALIEPGEKIERLEAAINRAGGLASQGASQELIRQVLAEAVQP